jgi:uncharacterized membrane protein (DUF373 family)
MFKKFENIIINSLVVLMATVVLLSTMRFIQTIGIEILKPPYLMLNSDQLFEIFGFFFIILIGLELLESLKVYGKEDVIQVEIILSIALIAVARKVITLDVPHTSGLTLLGVASIILSLSAGYLLIRKAHSSTKKK